MDATKLQRRSEKKPFNFDTIDPYPLNMAMKMVNLLKLFIFPFISRYKLKHG
jgi:hypothetical protein